MINTRKKTISQILDELNEIPDKAERIAETRRIASEVQTIAKLVQYAYHPDFNFDLPEGEVPTTLYKRSSHQEASPMFRAINRNELANITTKSIVPRHQKERLFISLLEKVAFDDVELILGIKAKRLPQRRLTEKFMFEAMPELFPNDYIPGEKNG